MTANCNACTHPSEHLLLHDHDLGLDVLAEPGYPVTITVAGEYSPDRAAELADTIRTKAIPAANKALRKKGIAV